MTVCVSDCMHMYPYKVVKARHNSAGAYGPDRHRDKLAEEKGVILKGTVARK